MDKIERLERLSKLFDDGKLSADEYESLKRRMLEESAPTSEQSDTPPPTQSPPQQEAPERQVTPGLYWAALGLGIASVFLGGTFGFVAWGTVVFSVGALISLNVDYRRWMAWTGVALGVVFSLMNVYLNGSLDDLFVDEPAPTENADFVAEPVPEDLSLGFTVDEVVTRWNGDSNSPPPYLTGEPEIVGRVFTYDAYGPVVVGIFDPVDKKVYRIGVQMFLVDFKNRDMLKHLCWTVSTPGPSLDDQTQECVHAFDVHGGLTPYIGVTVNDIPSVSSTWEFDGNTWTLEYDASPGSKDISFYVDSFAETQAPE